jgi:RNA-directed DNA polymerase
MSDTKVSSLPAGFPLQENLKNFIQEETQMMTSNEVSASSYCTQWQSINWKAVEQQVLKLQMRIAKATRETLYGCWVTILIGFDCRTTINANRAA